jgi:hypothetical protein
MPAKNSKLEFHPLTPERWRDFETLFGERGACRGCWCMWPRLSRSQYEMRKGARNKRAMKKLVEDGCEPGSSSIETASRSPGVRSRRAKSFYALNVRES